MLRGSHFPRGACLDEEMSLIPKRIRLGQWAPAWDIPRVPMSWCMVDQKAQTMTVERFVLRNPTLPLSRCVGLSKALNSRLLACL